MKKIMSCLALVALAVFTSAAFAQDPAPAQQPAPAQEPTLTSAEVKLDTTTDNKDQQTKLDVYVKTSDGHEVAKSEGNEGRWNKNSTHTVTLQIEGSPTKGEVANGSVTLTLHPQRRNKWSFNYKVTLKFSDGTFITKELNGCFLTEHDPARTDSLAGAIAVKNMDEERRANERQASADALARSQAQADEATRQKEQAQSEAAQAAAKAKSDLADSQAASATAMAAAQADAEKSRLAALAESEQARKAADAKAKSDLADSQAASATAIAAAQADAEKSRLAALAESAQARKAAAEQSEREKQELRNKLAVQLNLILETRDSARGLIVNISGVLFDTGKYTLRPGAREKLAKVSGIILAYPSLNLEVEGHTDSVGTDEYNMQLSENRANSVRDYLVQQGINTSSIAARGFGKSQPVATNDTAAGRQQNRRVELVVSGDVIGTPISH